MFDVLFLAILRGWAYTRGGMKTTTLFAAATAGLFLCSVSCERHEWAEVKKLHEGHGAHGAGHEEHAEGEHAGAEHKAEGEHGATESHGDKEKHGE